MIVQGKISCDLIKTMHQEVVAITRLNSCGDRDRESCDECAIFVEIIVVVGW